MSTTPRKRGRPRRPPLDGIRFGALVALVADGPHAYRCLCDCGRYSVALARNLLTGNTQSCGCMRGRRDAKRPAPLA